MLFKSNQIQLFATSGANNSLLITLQFYKQNLFIQRRVVQWQQSWFLLL